MKRTICFIILGILILLIVLNKTELFANTSIKLVERDLYLIKNAIDKVADLEYINSAQRISKNYLRIIIEAFNRSQESKSFEEQKKAFEENSFIVAIFSDRNLNLTASFKQELFTDLVEAYLFKRNLEMVPIRLIASDNITSNENMNKIKENLQNPQLKTITKFFIKYMLKFYDNSQPQHKSGEPIKRFEKNTPTFEDINNQNKDGLFF